MVSLSLSVHILSLRTSDTVMLMCQCGTTGVLPPTTLDHPLSDLSTAILHRATGFYSPIPPAPSPDFNPVPGPSDVRVNAFWFMALVSGLLAAFLAILVQQWVLDYIHVFPCYSDPLKSVQLCQHLRE